MLGVLSEGVGTEVAINPVSSQKVLIIQDDVAKCHRTNFLSLAQTEPLKNLINDSDFHFFTKNQDKMLKYDHTVVDMSLLPALF